VDAAALHPRLILINFFDAGANERWHGGKGIKGGGEGMGTDSEILKNV
jgi:hypothetical protein